MEILKQYPVLDTDDVEGADVIGGQLDAQHLAAVHHDRAPLAGRALEVRLGGDR
jgi:hypothetical protein